VAVAAFGATISLLFIFGIKPDNFWHAMEWGAVFLALYVGVLRLCFVNQLSELVHYFPARGAFCRALALPQQP
jgi:hypothetical protein